MQVKNAELLWCPKVRGRAGWVALVIALASFPDYLPIHKNLGILCDLYLNDPECALKQFEIYSERMPADAQVKIWIAEVRTRLGR